MKQVTGNTTVRIFNAKACAAPLEKAAKLSEFDDRQVRGIVQKYQYYN